MLQYVINGSLQGNKDLLIQEAEHYLSKELRGEVMTIAQQWKQEGMQQGLLQGRQEGRQEGEAALLKRLLERRFGILPLNYAQRIVNTDAHTLLDWADKVLDAETLEEVFE